MKKIALISLLILLVAGIDAAFAQQEKMLEKEFAVELVKEMKFDSLLPVAPNAMDCVALLENLGISPLGGWKPNDYLSTDAYTVIIAKALGKESIVYKEAARVNQNNIDVVNKRWQDAYRKYGRWLSLDELLQDTSIFPQGIVRSPFGFKYTDKNNDHQVDPQYPPTSFLARLRMVLQ